MNQADIFLAIAGERKRQDLIHPAWYGDNHGLAVLVEEVGEIAKALYEQDKSEMVKEIIQVAAVCVRWLENI